MQERGLPAQSGVPGGLAKSGDHDVCGAVGPETKLVENCIRTGRGRPRNHALSSSASLITHCFAWMKLAEFRNRVTSASLAHFLRASNGPGLVR